MDVRGGAVKAWPECSKLVKVSSTSRLLIPEVKPALLGQLE